MGVFGWLVDGVFYECEVYAHLETLTQMNDELRILDASVFEKQRRDIQAALARSKKRISQGKHPEWHHYEMALSAVQRQMIDGIYSQGALRVGSRDDVLYFEGFRFAIRRQAAVARELAQSYGMQAKFSVREPYTSEELRYNRASLI